MITDLIDYGAWIIFATVGIMMLVYQRRMLRNQQEIITLLKWLAAREKDR